MKEKIVITIKNHVVVFDFDKYEYMIIFRADENLSPEEKYDLISKIESDDDYLFFRKWLHDKYDFEKVPNSDRSKYQEKLKEYKEKYQQIMKRRNENNIDNE